MAMRLSSVVPFGRSFDEYAEMFSLSQSDLERSIELQRGGNQMLRIIR